MPRGGNRSNIQNQENTNPNPPEIHIHQDAPPLFCGAFLKKNYWDMSKKLEKTYECPICLDEIDCPRCFELLATCGHHFHQRCILIAFEARLQCPVCRSPLESD